MPSFIHFQHDPSPYLSTMPIRPLTVESLVRLVSALVTEPAETITTLLYFSNLLPRNLNLERLVRREFLHPRNYLFHLLINLLRCFW